MYSNAKSEPLESKDLWPRDNKRMIKFIKRSGERKIHSMVDILGSNRPSSAPWASGFPAALFPWLLWPHRFLQRASCHGNAYQSFVLFAGRVKREDDLGTKGSIYLFALRDERDEGRGGDGALQVFASGRELAGEMNPGNKRAVPLVGASDAVFPCMRVHRCGVLTSGRHMWF